MSEMVERVANALHELRRSNREEYENVIDVPWPEIIQNGFLNRYVEALRDQSRTAIAAMRDPTVAMFEYGDLIRHNGHPSGCKIETNETDDIWRAMIDEALK